MIDRFDGTKYRFLSNFWPAVVCYDGCLYSSVEHAYQAAKTLDIETRIEICNAKSPGEAKRLGRKVVCRPNWENIKYTHMEYLLRQKFNDPELKQMLLDTGDHELIESNTWGDVYWGVCDGKGENNLGKILMDLRREYISVKRYTL